MKKSTKMTYPSMSKKAPKSSLLAGRAVVNKNTSGSAKNFGPTASRSTKKPKA